MKFGVESKHNDIQKLKLELDKSFYDIKSNNSIKQFRINSLEADVENAKRLYKAGGGTREDVEKAELNLKVARLEKQQLENEIKSKQQTMQVEVREAGIAASIQQNDLHELARKLKLANIVASREGVVTWVNKNIGAAVHEGDALARIANLSSFKVLGSIADTYLDQLHNGMTAIIRINETQVRGTVVNIQPAVQNRGHNRNYFFSYYSSVDQQRQPDCEPRIIPKLYCIIYWLTNLFGLWITIGRIPRVAYVKVKCGDRFKRTIKINNHTIIYYV